MFKLSIKNDTWPFFLRIMVPTLSIIHFLAFYPDYHLFFSNDALINPEIMDASLDSKGISIFTINKFLLAHGYVFDYFILVKSFIFAYLVFLFFMIIGFFTRISSVISILLHMIILQTMYNYLYGVDFFYSVLLFYCAILPLNKYYSIDNLISKKRTSKINTGFEQFISTKTVLRVMQANMCIAYFFSGFDKVLGVSWRNGEAIWKAVHNFSGIVNYERIDSLASTPVFMIAAWATVLLELLYPLMVNIKYTRLIWVGGIIGMHLTIVMILGLFHFSAIMIVFNLITYIVPYSASFSILRNKSGSTSMPQAVPEIIPEN